MLCMFPAVHSTAPAIHIALRHSVSVLSQCTCHTIAHVSFAFYASVKLPTAGPFSLTPYLPVVLHGPSSGVAEDSVPLSVMASTVYHNVAFCLLNVLQNST